MVSNIEKNFFGATLYKIVLLFSDSLIKSGDYVYRIKENSVSKAVFPRIKVGYEVIGKIVGATGVLLNRYDITKNQELIYDELSNQSRDLFIKAPGIIEREPVQNPMYTGIHLIDAFFPIGRGQRELIIGDRTTGKTNIALTAILNQLVNNKDVQTYLGSNNTVDVYCIYVAIGQKRNSVVRVYNTLKKKNALGYTTIVSASSADTAALQYFSPYAGCTIGEFFMHKGHDALIAYDDLSKHAVAYRQMSLLLRRPPGREAYPGDIFYKHSSLLERSSQMSKNHGGGSLTAFPIIETQSGDVSAYIPTNVISITDGQIYLDTDLFNKGIRPAVNVGLSVSRVGSAAQNLSMRKLGNKLKLKYSEYKKFEGVGAMSSDVDASIVRIINTGLRLVELFKQRDPKSKLEQIVLSYAGVNGYLDYVDVKDVRLFALIMSQYKVIGKLFHKFMRNHNVQNYEWSYVLPHYENDFYELFLSFNSINFFHSYMNNFFYIYTFLFNKINKSITI
uniref:ATP synthase F1 subunit alpha n=1 Tax=Pharyngomonas kirbyi TaxID=63601 RepID=A0A1W6R249_9EUKA|nr:ATP synthase F1 subunit alpha [Pharyngomonas kirbyi]ARO47973.1 ATP synthase F1 subunit alpha [Pharyngomonas kirbyi]|eukprot:gb/GECH01003660.1/.p1 GENE.gb/GECH01003660.1/~~gb/GECH01003660.1/.p1  ORF type:complete len:505 (+),score=4.52 gb/GECH01003660.1/:1-1515(+)